MMEEEPAMSFDTQHETGDLCKSIDFSFVDLKFGWFLHNIVQEFLIQSISPFIDVSV